MQLHLTSLPGGRLGAAAYVFVDWLAAAGQSWWQMLPLGPPDRYRSPYKAHSAFAAWPGLLAGPRARVTREEALDFRERQADWIDDWARFAGRGAVDDQVRFEREWSALRRYAAERGVRLIGDVPIYVAPGSADHRAHPELFQRGLVAGTPPDAFTDKGQLWGNPLYDWPALRRRGATAGGSSDCGARSSSSTSPASTTSAASWPTGPSRPGRATPSAGAGGAARGGRCSTPPPRGWARCRSSPRTSASSRRPSSACATTSGCRGWSCCSSASTRTSPRSPHRPANHVEHRIVYTGTHDNDTLRGWYQSLLPETRAEVDAAVAEAGVGEREPWWSLIRLAFASPARVAMVQAQDVLGLGSEARMNKPGTARGAWRWRLEDGALTPALAARLREATVAADRAPGSPSQVRA